MMVFCFRAAMVPKVTPSNTAKKKAVVPILADTGNAWLTEIIDGEILVFERGAQITLHQVAQVGEILHANGFVEPVFGLNVGDDFGGSERSLVKGLPGAKRIMKKETVIKTSRVGIASNSRLKMNFNIDISCPVLLPNGRGCNKGPPSGGPCLLCDLLL